MSVTSDQLKLNNVTARKRQIQGNIGMSYAVTNPRKLNGTEKKMPNAQTNVSARRSYFRNF